MIAMLMAGRRGLVVLLVAAAVSATACGDTKLPGLALEQALGGARFEQPVEVGAYPDGRTFVVERGGMTWLVGAAGDRTLLLDIADRIDARLGEGLLSVALDPAFEENGWVWAFYYAAGEPPRAELARFTVGREDVTASGRAVVVLTVRQPGYNQNGGAIRFDARGYLFLSLGDGSASSDPFHNGQDLSTLPATVVRIDTRASTAAEPYRVPPDNPFLGDPEARPEIFAYGFRNPFRMSIDAESGEIWLGDVGVSSAEEVNRVEAGGNYGWSLYQGEQCWKSDGCDTTGLTAPVYWYAHTEKRCAVIGGVTYRGRAIPALDGRVLFGDLCSAEIWALAASRQAAPDLLTRLDGMPVTFGVDRDGEVLVADYAGGGIYRLVAAE